MIFHIADSPQKDFSQYWLKIYRYYAIYYPFFQMEPHTHDEWEIMYVVHGKCKISCVEDHREKEYELREGEYILLSGGIPHKLTVEKEAPCRILNLEGKAEPAHLALHMSHLTAEKSFGKFVSNPRNVLLGNDDGSLYAALHALIQELKKESAAPDSCESNLLTDFLLGQFLVLLARQSTISGSRRRGSNLYVRRTLEYLEANFDQDIRIADIAGTVGISEGYLQRLFKKETGYSIVEKISELRIEKAKVLLETSSLPIIDIAINVGFNSRQHFAVIFTQLTGSSPMQWRKNMSRCTKS